MREWVGQKCVTFVARQWIAQKASRMGGMSIVKWEGYKGNILELTRQRGCEVGELFWHLAVMSLQQDVTSWESDVRSLGWHGNYEVLAGLDARNV